MNHKESVKLLELEAELATLEEELEFIAHREIDLPENNREYHQKLKQYNAVNAALTSEFIRHSRAYRRDILASIGV